MTVLAAIEAITKIPDIRNQKPEGASKIIDALTHAINCPIKIIKMQDTAKL